MVQDPEIALTRALNGEVDLLAYHFNSLQNKPVVAENRERGEYEIFDLIPSSMNTLVLCLNLCHKDKALREVFNNKDFRIGLSHAINRQEIIDVTLQSQGEPWQAAPRKESAYFDEEMAKQYTEYDVDLANRFLDEAGYADKDADGMRLGPNGEPIRFQIETLTADPDYSSPWVDMLELVQGYWREVGVEMDIKTEDRSLFYERKAANQHDAALWFGSPGGLETETPLEPRWYAPVNGESNYAIPWATWFASNGEAGQEPPAAVREQLEVYKAVKATSDPEERFRLMREVLNIAKEQFYNIGISLQPYSYGIVRNDFRNAPDPMIGAWLYVDPGSTNPEQYWKEQA
jgi:peptide/nickel transport system substrate-binding protein